MNFSSNFVKTTYGDTIVECKFQKSNGITMEKSLHIDEYINMLSGSVKIKKKEEPFRNIGKLPKAYYDGAISSDGKVAAVFCYPGQKWYFRHAQSSNGSYIAFPSLVFGFATNTSGRICKSFCFASKTEELEPSTQLYLYPYGNVSHTGRICWGNGSQYLQDMRSIADLERAVEVFFSAGTAAHYYQQGVNTFLKKSHAELVKEMELRESFPLDILRDADTSIAELMEMLVKIEKED